MSIAIYTRVSTREQTNGETIKSQQDEIKKYAIGKEYDYDKILKYTDDGYSGEDLNRPDIDRLRDDIKNNKITKLIAFDVDRISRDATNLGIIVREIKYYQVKLEFVKTTIEDSPQGMLMLQMLGVFAQFEKEMIKDRTRRGRNYKARVKQEIVGHKMKYGYKYIPKNKDGSGGYIEIIPEERKIVEMMFEWVVNEGLSARSVCKRLTKMKILTRSGGTVWAKSTVLGILRNEIYCGVMSYNKHRTYKTPENLYGNNEGNDNIAKRKSKLRPQEEWISIQLPEHLCIIPRQTWELARDQLDKNRQFSPRNTKYQYLLQGLTVCNQCSSPFTGQRSKGSFVYRCGNRHKQFPLEKNCSMRSANGKILEDLVWKNITKIMINPNILNRNIKRLSKKISDKNLIIKKIREIEKNIGAKRMEIDRFTEMYSKNIINIEQLEKNISRIKTEKNQLDEEKNKINQELNKNKLSQISEWSIKQWCSVVSERVKNMTFEEKKKIIRHFINNIQIDDDKVIINSEIELPQDIYKNEVGGKNNTNNKHFSNLKFKSVPLFTGASLVYCARQKQKFAKRALLVLVL